jgi:DNA-binding GntR family transcriptional regulator
LRLRVIRNLQDAIFSGELQPGDPISEIRTARAEKVSQTTVREALAKLESEGLVRRVANRGTFVTQMSPRDFGEYLRLRVVLESMAAVDAARNMTEAHFTQLEPRLKAISAAVERNEYFEAAKADLEFHRTIWKLSGDRTLLGILDQLTAPLFAFASLCRRSTHEELRRVMQSHAPIVVALRSRDAETIREAIRSHIETSYVRFLTAEVIQFHQHHIAVAAGPTSSAAPAASYGSQDHSRVEEAL